MAGELPIGLCGRPYDRRPRLDRDSPGRKNGNAANNPRIRVYSPTSQVPPSPLRDSSLDKPAPAQCGDGKSRAPCLTMDIRVL
jgi:hypothetical protein